MLLRVVQMRTDKLHQADDATDRPTYRTSPTSAPTTTKQQDAYNSRNDEAGQDDYRNDLGYERIDL